MHQVLCDDPRYLYFSDDSRYLLIGEDYRVRVMEVATWKWVHSVPLSYERIEKLGGSYFNLDPRNMQFDSRSKTLSFVRDGIITRDLEKKSWSESLVSERHSIKATARDASGRMVALALKDGRINLLEAPGGKTLFTVPTGSILPESIAAHMGAERMLVGFATQEKRFGPRTYEIWDLAEKRRLAHFDNRMAENEYILFTPDLNYLIMHQNNSYLLKGFKVYSFSTRRISHVDKNTNSNEPGFAFAGGRKDILAYRYRGEKNITFLNLDTMIKASTLTVPPGDIAGMTMSPDGTMLAVGSFRNGVAVFAMDSLLAKDTSANIFFAKGWVDGDTFRHTMECRLSPDGKKRPGYETIESVVRKADGELIRYFSAVLAEGQPGADPMPRAEEYIGGITRSYYEAPRDMKISRKDCDPEGNCTVVLEVRSNNLKSRMRCK